MSADVLFIGRLLCAIAKKGKFDRKFLTGKIAANPRILPRFTISTISNAGRRKLQGLPWQVKKLELGVKLTFAVRGIYVPLVGAGIL